MTAEALSDAELASMNPHLPRLYVHAHISDEDVDVSTQDIDNNSGESTFATLSDELSLQELKIYSKSILYDMVFGRNSANEKEFLREIYCRTLEILAHSE